MASSGTSSITLDDFTLSSAGSIAIGGALSVTLGDFTSDGTISLYLLSDDALDAVADNVEQIAFGAALERLTFNGLGWLVAHAASSVTLDDLTLSAVATLGNTGTVSATLGDFTVSAAGSGGWYVDSVSGNDSNSGRNSAAPLLTLAGLYTKSPVAGETVYLKRGSTFREELTDLAAGVIVRPYSSGARPIIDGRNAATAGSFTKTGGRTNVYQYAWAFNFDDSGGKCRHRAWEDGAMMRRITWTGTLSNDLATLDSTPGAFLSDTPSTNGPDTIYIHPLGNTDPRVDGKTYLFSKRRWAVQLYETADQAEVYSVDAIGNAHADGSLAIDGHIEDSYARDGRVHNGLVIGTAIDCVATGIDIYDPANDFGIWVTYYDVNNSGPSQRNTVFRNCTADTGQGYVGLGSGFLVHTDGSRSFGTVQYEDCTITGPDVAFSGNNADLFIHKGCNATAIKHYCLSVPNGGSTASKVLILGGYYSNAATAPDSMLYSATIGATFVYDVIFQGVKVYRNTGGQGPIAFDVPDSFLTVRRCSFANADSAGVFSHFKQGHIAWDHNVTRGTNQTPVTLGKASAMVAAFDADYNVNSASSGSVAWGKDNPSHTDYIGLAAWQTYLNGAGLGTGKEANSRTDLNPQLADPANGDFTIGNATVISMGAGAEQDEDNDAALVALFNLYKVADP